MSAQTATVGAIKEDVSGQSRLGRNVAYAWGGYLVNVAAGIIMPRLISDRLGQETLGVWDFAWGVISYFGLVQLGLSGSVNRYVAKHRATGDHKALSQSVSTIGLSLRFSALLVFLISICAALWVIPLFGNKIGKDIATAQWVVFILGVEIAGSLLLTVYGAIIVGCHRWDIHNTTSAISYAVMTLGMVVAVLSGGGLISLAVVHWLSMNGADIVRWRLSRKVCPEFVMDTKLATWSVWKEQAWYSAKSLMPRLADLVSNQSLTIMITAFLGPELLAVFSRPRSLMIQGRTVTGKFGSILIPTSSSLHAKADKSQLQATFFRSTYFISSLVMPGVAVLVFAGNEVIRLWMGKGYIYPGLVETLAIGCFPGLIQEPVWSIVSGMNRHGKIALAKLGAATCSAAMLWVGLQFLHWNLMAAALAYSIPLFVVDSMVTPYLACRLLEVSLAKYYLKTYIQPLVGTIPFVVLGVVTEMTYQTHPAIAAGTGVLAIVILGLFYWKAFQALRHRSKQSA